MDDWANLVWILNRELHLYRLGYKLSKKAHFILQVVKLNHIYFTP